MLRHIGPRSVRNTRIVRGHDIYSRTPCKASVAQELASLVCKCSKPETAKSLSQDGRGYASSETPVSGSEPRVADLPNARLSCRPSTSTQMACRSR